MTTRYPTDLPAAPEYRWGANVEGHGGDVDAGNAYVVVTIEAADAEEAERRALSVLDHDYCDDLRGADADATPAGADRYEVTVRLQRPR